ncbi:MAG: cytochrome-c peroxidase [Filimonas sp.]|nr:cytochrome-c peroxidase [Filimonas sp.]
MKKLVVLFSLITIIVLSLSFTHEDHYRETDAYTDSLRAIYSQPSSQWPKPFVDAGVPWQELGITPESPLKSKMDSLRHLVNLGKILFFDPRLSGSGQISCASCHIPDLSWADGREKAVGHDQQTGKRNTPSLFNVWYFKRLFWDGRSSGLEDQAFGPINNELEMHSDMALVPQKIKNIPGYKSLFDSAYGSFDVDAEKIVHAIATFEKTIVSRKSDFDYFLEGKKTMMNDAAIRGLHLFRTKARCMNCHYGPLFSDNDFHNIGLTYYGREYEDLGLYKHTHKAEDVGKFKTPSLRDVMRTRPWMHNGLFDNMDGVLNMYNAGMPQPKRKPEQANDTLFPKTDVLVKKLGLTQEEKKDIIAFLEAITAEPWKMRIPALPK